MNEIIDSIAERMSVRVWAPIDSLLLALPFIDWVDFSLRVASAIVGIIVGIFMIKHYRLKNEALKKENELRDQQIHAHMEAKKKK